MFRNICMHVPVYEDLSTTAASYTNAITMTIKAPHAYNLPYVEIQVQLDKWKAISYFYFNDIIVLHYQ